MGFFALFITGVILYVVGSLWEKARNAETERRIREREARRASYR